MMSKIIIMLLCLLPMNLFASEKIWYAGIEIGTTDADVTIPAFGNVNEIEENNAPGSNIMADIDSEDSGYKIYAGYTQNTHLDLEFGYINLGKISGSIIETANDPFVGVSTSTLIAEASIQGIYLSAIGKLPVSHNIAVNGKFGTFFWDAEGDFDFRFDGLIDFSVGGSADSNDTDIFYGVGLEFGALSLQYEIYNVDDDEITFLSAGFKYHF